MSTSDDQIEQVERREDRRRAHQLRTWEVRTAGRSSLLAAHFAATSGFSSTTINGTVLLNSASAGAVLALLGSLWEDTEVLVLVLVPATVCLKIYASGAFLAIVTAGLSYLGQSAYSISDITDVDHATKLEAHGPDSVTEREKVVNRRWRFAGHWLRVIAILTALGAILSFGFGSWYGLEALEIVRDSLPVRN